MDDCRVLRVGRVVMASGGGRVLSSVENSILRGWSLEFFVLALDSDGLVVSTWSGGGTYVNTQQTGDLF